MDVAVNRRWDLHASAGHVELGRDLRRTPSGADVGSPEQAGGEARRAQTFALTAGTLPQSARACGWPRSRSRTPWGALPRRLRESAYRRSRAGKIGRRASSHTVLLSAPQSEPRCHEHPHRVLSKRPGDARRATRSSRNDLDPPRRSPARAEGWSRHWMAIATRKRSSAVMRWSLSLRPASSWTHLTLPLKVLVAPV